MNQSASEYYQKATAWEEEVYLSLRQSRNRAYIVASIAAFIAIMCVIALVVTLPMKEFVPMVITVDKQTGYLEPATMLEDNTLSEKDAVTQSFLMRYLNARESYNPAVLEENYNLAQYLSGDNAAKEHKALWDSANPDNPSKVYDRSTSIEVRVKSIQLLEKNRATIRFQRNLITNNVTTSDHWVATLTFVYENEPTQMKERLINPLGFKVTNYRLTQEIME